MDEQSAALAARLAKDSNILKYLLDEHGVWKGIVALQNSLDDLHCSKYLSTLERIEVTTLTATPEQRVEAFVQVMLKK